MKEKTIIFIVGLLLGAIISTGSIYIYTIANNSSNNEENMQIPNANGQTELTRPNGGTPPEMPSNNQENSQSAN